MTLLPVGCEKENITARRNKALSNPSERRPVRLRWTKLASGGIVDSAEQWSTETETTADIRAAADLTDWRSKQGPATLGEVAPYSTGEVETLVVAV